MGVILWIMWAKDIIIFFKYFERENSWMYYMTPCVLIKKFCWVTIFYKNCPNECNLKESLKVADSLKTIRWPQISDDFIMNKYTIGKFFTFSAVWYYETWRAECMVKADELQGSRCFYNIYVITYAASFIPTATG